MEGTAMREPVACGTHLLWFLFTIPAAAFLVKFSGRSRPIVIYTIGLLSCFGASAAFHGASYSGALLMLDHVCIYLLIGGTYTPVLCATQKGSNLIASLSIIWGGCATGIFI